MTWAFAYTPQIWPPVMTVLLLIVLGISAWHRRTVPGALRVAIVSLGFDIKLTRIQSDAGKEGYGER